MLPIPVEPILPQLQMGSAGRVFIGGGKSTATGREGHTAVDVAIMLEPDFSVIQLSWGCPCQISLLLQQVGCGWDYYFELLTGVRRRFMSLQSKFPQQHCRACILVSAWKNWKGRRLLLGHGDPLIERWDGTLWLMSVILAF